MSTCWRCGIQYEGSGDLCEDCFEVSPESLDHWPVLADYNDQMWRDRWAVVHPYYQEGKFDGEIAEILGISVRMVAKTRQHFGQPANVREGMNLWKDQEAQRQHASTMVKYRVAAKRGTLGRMVSFEKNKNDFARANYDFKVGK